MLKNIPLFYLFLSTIFYSGQIPAQSLNQLPPDNDVEILIILPNGYGPNYFLIRDTFESFGWNVTTCARGNSVSICHLFTNIYSRDVFVDDILTNINHEGYDAVFLVSSEQYIANPMGDIIQTPEAIYILRQFEQTGRVLSTFCQGIRVFANATIIDGKNVTGSLTYRSDCINAGAVFHSNQNAPIKDGKMVTTTRGRTNCVRFPEQIEKALQGN